MAFPISLSFCQKVGVAGFTLLCILPFQICFALAFLFCPRQGGGAIRFFFRFFPMAFCALVEIVPYYFAKGQCNPLFVFSCSDSIVLSAVVTLGPPYVSPGRFLSQRKTAQRKNRFRPPQRWFSALENEARFSDAVLAVGTALPCPCRPLPYTAPALGSRLGTYAAHVGDDCDLLNCKRRAKV